MDPRYLPQTVAYDGKHSPGTIVIDTPNKVLYLVEAGGKATRYGIGVDTIDLDAATAAGIIVTNNPTYCIEEVAEHTMALLLACARKVVFFVKHGPRRVDRRPPFARRLPMPFRAGTRGRVFARVTYTRKGSRRVRHITVSRRFVMCA